MIDGESSSAFTIFKFQSLLMVLGEREQHRQAIVEPIANSWCRLMAGGAVRKRTGL